MMQTFFLFTVCVVMLFMVVLLLFVLDDIVFNKHFTNKLHRVLGVDRESSRQ